MKIKYNINGNEYEYTTPIGMALATLDKAEIINIVLGTGVKLKDLEYSMMQLYGNKIKDELEESAIKKYNEKGMNR